MSRYKDRTNYSMYVTFTHPETGYSEEEMVWIPFDIFVEGIRHYCEFADVGIDGTDKNIWNLMVDLECLDRFEDDENFIEFCKEKYLDSYYFEEDLDYWIDDYEFDNNLGRYKEEPEEEEE